MVSMVMVVALPLIAARIAPKPAAEIAPYPPMHWHSWNTFCAEDMVNETNMKQMAEALIETGMVAAGYDTVNVVCNGWTGRDPVTHVLQENRILWPNGIAGFAEFLHGKGMHLGCYTSPADQNCCGEPGSLGYEGIDMEFFARVGCDHVMVDWCRSYVDPKQTKEEYARIGDGIANSSNPNMLYGIWPGGMGKSWKWSAEVGGHYWRTANDIKNVWDSDVAKMVGGVLHNFDTAMSIPNIAAQTVPGRYSFLDQMVVGVAANGTGDDNHKGGVPGPGLNFEETQAHMSMWVMAASPLLTCNDVRNMSASIKEILTNPEVLAVHKDPLAKMGVRIDVGGGIDEDHATHPCASEYSVYGKELSDGSSAVMVLNRGDANLSVALPMEDVGDSMHDCYAIRDLWQHRNLTLGRVLRPAGQYAAAPSMSAGLTLVVPRHGVRMLRLWPIAPPPPPPPTPPPKCPAGFTAHAGGYWQNLDPSGAVGSGTVPNCAATCKATAGCVAFEVYTIGVPVSQDECYLFLTEMAAPFTPNLHSFTCVLA